ncbi:MAG: DNA polymerase Y family protein [Planctomycetia bacterium]|nr:DNA polymerase Y family protein [Planctomycetia bacterium]
MSRILCLRFRPPPADDEPARNRRGPRVPPAVVYELPADLRDRLRADVEEFSPIIGWVAGWPAPCLCLEVGATSAWFGGETALIERLQAWAAERRLSCTASIADTLGTAWAIVHYGLPRNPPFVSRIVADDETAKILSPLPVEALRISKPTSTLLRELGIDFIGKLLDLPRAALTERFDAELLLRLNQALGIEPELFAAVAPESQLEAALNWEYGLVDIDPLVEVWEHLLPQLLGPLAERGHGVVRLLAEIRGESCGLRRLVVGLLRPSVDSKKLVDLLRLRLESIRFVEPVVGTRLVVLESAMPAVEQQMLFAELAPPIEAQAWTTLIERLSGRLGSDAVSQVCFCADHQPERTWKAMPQFTAHSLNTSAGPATKKSKTKLKVDATDGISQGLPRPTSLLTEPRSIRVIALALQGHPQRFRDVDTEHRVACGWGPERIETGWWRGPSIRRDYYRVATEAGTHVWLFRDLQTRGWFLHGWFD